MKTMQRMTIKIVASVVVVAEDGTDIDNIIAALKMDKREGNFEIEDFSVEGYEKKDENID